VRQSIDVQLELIWTILFAAATLALAPRVARADNPTNSMGSRYYRLSFDPAAPRLTAFHLDSVGGGTRESLIRPDATAPARPWRTRKRDDGDTVDYIPDDAPADAPPAWSFTTHQRTLTVRSRFSPTTPADPFTLRFDPKTAHATLLGRMPAARQVALPAVLHVPDHGTLRITSNLEGATLGYDARRFVPEPFVEVTFPAATKDRPQIDYTLEVAAIQPPTADNVPDWRARSFLNIFQLNPRLRVLANNAASDPVAFTVYKYADVAAAKGLPPLADNLTALNLVRDTLDRYLAGMTGYGQVGYRRNMDGADTLEWASPFDALDALPSLLSAACTVTTASNDLAWARRNWPALRTWADRMLATDKNHNGLLEYGLSGNANTWSGKNDQRPSNWWDQIGFGHEDAYANALAYRALTQLVALAQSLDQHDDATRFTAAAQKLKAAYRPAFYSPATGLLAGWRSADGQLHDYAFTFVTACAVCWNLLDRADADRMMTTLLARMKAAGYTNFRLGLPGNLIPIRRADYVTLKKRWGGPEKEDGSDAFGIFENGGATHCFAYFTIRALQKLDRRAEADAILTPMLAAFEAAEFQGKCASGHTREWKDWQGRCWGYEGFLADGYLTLLASTH
jgi:hypothetical protein